MDKELRRIEKRTNEKLQDFYNSSVEVLNEGLPYEKRMSFGKYSKYTVKELIMILSIEETITDPEEKEKALKLIDVIKSLNSTTPSIYASERQKVKDSIKSKTEELSNMGVIVELSLTSIILQGFSKKETETELENKTETEMKNKRKH